jgi:HEPN domain-containing protein
MEPFAHLLDSTQRQGLAMLLQELATRFAPAAVYCFGCRVHRFSRSGCFAARACYTRADLDLLMLSSEGMSRSHDVQDFAAACYTGGVVNLICHTQPAAQLALERGHYFFTRVAAQAELLYGAALTASAPIASIGSTGWEAGTERANAFYTAAAGCPQSSPGLCLFLLHQAVEQALCGLLLRHTGYRASIHHLGRLLRMCQTITTAHDWFAGGSLEERRRFILLLKSYNAARYGSSFDVTLDDATFLLNRVRSLLDEITLDHTLTHQYEPIAEPPPAAAVQDDLRAMER